MQSFSLHVNKLEKRYGATRVFDSVTFSHTEGILGIAGPNGSGKSTLLLCMAGLRAPTAGTVDWKRASDSISTPEARKHMGYAAPYINLYPELSCSENLHFLLELRGNAPRTGAVEEALMRTGIGSLASRPYGQLSTGQQQRMRLASALVHNPGIIFLDEPGSNLDKKGRKLIARLADSFKTAGKLAVIASNNPDELALCDQIYSVAEERPGRSEALAEETE